MSGALWDFERKIASLENSLRTETGFRYDLERKVRALEESERELNRRIEHLRGYIDGLIERLERVEQQDA